MDHPDFPVKVNAVLALAELIQFSDFIAQHLAPQVSKVVQDILRLSEESELDILNHAMEVLVDRYQTELLPVASQLAQRLCETYIKLVRDTVAGQDDGAIDLDSLVTAPAADDEDKTLHAMGVAKTISTVIDAVDGSAELLAEVGEHVVAAVIFTLERQAIGRSSSSEEIRY